MKQKFVYFILIIAIAASIKISHANNEESAKNKPKKSVVDMTDAEIEKIYEEWEVS
jgi:hypothetical protein